MQVQWTDGIVLTLEGQLLREHVRGPRGHHRIADSDRPAKTPATTLALLARARRVGPALHTLCTHIHTHEGAAGTRRILGALALAKRYGPIALEDAAKAALERRVLTYRFLRRHLFEPSFCRPGVGHDKGGVEARGKAVRLQALTPIPSADSLDAINTALLAQLDGRVDTRRAGTTETIAARFVEEARLLRPLDVPFVAEAPPTVSISPRALGKVYGAWYSVPCEWADLDLTAWVGGEYFFRLPVPVLPHTDETRPPSETRAALVRTPEPL